MDFVWLFHAAAAQDDEIRWSVRSVEKFFNGTARPIIIGDKPAWYGGIHIPCPRIKPVQWHKQADQIHRLRMAVNTSLVSEQFIWMMDDIYFMDEVDLSTLKQAWFTGQPLIRSREDNGRPSANWTHLRNNSVHEAFRKGANPAYDYATHLPHYVEKTKLRKLLEEYNYFHDRMFLWETLYENKYLEGRTPRPARDVFFRVTKHLRRDQLEESMVRPIWNNGVRGWGRPLREILEERIAGVATPQYDIPLRMRADTRVATKTRPAVFGTVCPHMGEYQGVVRSGQCSQRSKQVDTFKCNLYETTCSVDPVKGDVKCCKQCDVIHALADKDIPALVQLYKTRKINVTECRDRKAGASSRRGRGSKTVVVGFSGFTKRTQDYIPYFTGGLQANGYTVLRDDRTPTPDIHINAHWWNNMKPAPKGAKVKVFWTQETFVHCRIDLSQFDITLGPAHVLDGKKNPTLTNETPDLRMRQIRDWHKHDNHIYLPTWAVTCLNFFRHPMQFQGYLNTPELLCNRDKFPMKKLHRSCWICHNGRNEYRNGLAKKLEAMLDAPTAYLGDHWRNGHDKRLSARGAKNRWQTKLDVLKDYRITVALENQHHPGYVTEKVMHALMVKTVPYTEKFNQPQRDIRSNCLLFADDQDAVREVVNNKARLTEMANEPVFEDPEKIREQFGPYHIMKRVLERLQAHQP